MPSPRHDNVRDGAKPQVIYVMGAGRSGSTVLGVVLGNCDGVFFAGELDAWLRRSGTPNFPDPRRERFWAQVNERVSGAAGLFGERAWRELEHSLSACRPWRWRARRGLRRRYRATMSELYRSIADVADQTHIVDTSHYPLRARELRQIEGIDLCLIYMVRRARDVVASFARTGVDQPSKGTLATNLYLLLTHLLSGVVFLTHPRERRLFLRYEDLTGAPEHVAHTVLKHFGAPDSAPNVTELHTGLAFQGNRMLNAQTVALKASASPKLSRTASWLTAGLQLPCSLAHAKLAPRAGGERGSAT